MVKFNSNKCVCVCVWGGGGGGGGLEVVQFVSCWKYSL